jgi:cGMP-dependent protein kinase 1
MQAFYFFLLNKNERYFFITIFLNTEEFRFEILKQMRYSFCEKGEMLINEGDPAFYFFIISKGRVEVIIEGEVVKNLSEGDYFGDLALLYNAPRSASIKCLDDCYFWTLHRDSFQSTLRRMKLD